jgi:hypothetical protein
MAIERFISGVIPGLLLGVLLCSRVLQGWQCRARRKRDIDRQIEQCQALFRQIERDKYQRL